MLLKLIFTQSSSSRIMTGSNFNTSRATNVRQPKFGLLTIIVMFNINSI